MPPRKPKIDAKRAARGAAEHEPSELRIIGGTMRGRKLLYSGDPLTRPMKDRVREAAFNLIGPAVAGTRAIDAFAGTGALGLEAISRGAATAIFLERHFPTARLIEQNCRELGVADRCQVTPTSAFVWVRREIIGEGGPAQQPRWGRQAASAPWLVFLSPPYDFYVERAEEMLSLVATLVENAPAGSMVLVECDARFNAAELPLADAWDVRQYPPATLALYRKAPAAETHASQPDA